MIADSPTVAYYSYTDEFRSSVYIDAMSRIMLWIAMCLFSFFLRYMQPICDIIYPASAALDNICCQKFELPIVLKRFE